MKTIDYVVGLVHGLLGSLSVKKYAYEKPTSAKDTEYVVINSLPITSDIMQKCIVNVNYHVKDKAPGIPDKDKLNAGATAVLAILEKVSTTTYLIDSETQEQIKEPNLDEHYINLRFSFKTVNI